MTEFEERTLALLLAAVEALNEIRDRLPPLSATPAPSDTVPDQRARIRAAVLAAAPASVDAATVSAATGIRKSIVNSELSALTFDRPPEIERAARGKYRAIPSQADSVETERIVSDAVSSLIARIPALEPRRQELLVAGRAAANEAPINERMRYVLRGLRRLVQQAPSE